MAVPSNQVLDVGVNEDLVNLFSTAIKVAKEEIFNETKSLRCEGEGSVVPKSLTPNCQEKPLARSGCPYRKPTQVGEERILRRAREPSLRNSAK